MSRKFKNALHGLKNTYPSPNQERRDAFLASLPQETEEKRRVILPFLHLRRMSPWYALPSGIVAAVMLGVGISAYRHHQPHTVPTVPVESTVQTTASTATTYTQTVTEVLQESTAASDPALFPAQTTAPVASDVPAVTGGTAPVGSTASSASPAQSVPFAQTATFPQSFTTAQQGSTSAQTSKHTGTTTQTTTQAAAAQSGTTTRSTSMTTAEPTDPVVQTTATRATTTTAMTTRRETEAMATTAPSGGAAEEPLPSWETEPATESPSDDPVSSEAEPTDVVEDTTSNAADGSAYTLITPPVTYTPTSVVLEWDDFLTEENLTGTASDWWHPMADRSTEILCGRVESVWYTMIGGMPYTQIDVRVITSYRASRAGTMLSVYVPGGYVPLRVMRDTYGWAQVRTADYTEIQIAQTTVHEPGSGQTAPVYGDECLFFLQPASEVFPSGAFVLTASEDAARLYPSGSGYTDASGRYSVTAGALQSYLNS